MNKLNDLLTSVNSVSSATSVLKNPEPRTANPEPGADVADLLENLKLQLEHAQSMANNSPNIFLKASMNIAAMEMFSVLNRFDTVTLSKRLEEKPELYFQVLNSQCTLMKAHLEQQKFEFRQKQAKAKQRERQQKLRPRKPILITATTIGSIHTQVRQASTRHKAPPPAQVPAILDPQQLANDHGPDLEASTTRNTGTTETVDVSPGCIQGPTTDHARPITDHPDAESWNPEPCMESICSAAPSEDLVCSQS